MTVHKLATNIFVAASLLFGVFGITMLLISQPGQGDNALLSKLLGITVFVILPSFAVSVAGKYLGWKQI